MMRHGWIGLGVVLGLLGLRAEAQPTTGWYPGTRIAFEHIGLEEGLSQSSVLTILQDRHGFLWFGTQDGLNRYDGYTFTVYRQEPLDSLSLSASFVQTLYEDRAGTLWVGTWGGGLNRMDPDTQTFHAYRHDPNDPTSLADDIITALYEDEAGAFWVGTANGLHRFDRTTGRFERLIADGQPGSLSHNFVWSITEDAAGHLWVGTLSGGANRWDREAEQFTIFRKQAGNPQSLSSDANVLVYTDRAGTLWLGTADGLNRFDSEMQTFQRFPYQPTSVMGLGGQVVYALWEDARGNFWVGTGDAGVYRMDRATETFTAYRHRTTDPQSLSKDVVRALYEDASGNVWVGTDGGSLNKYAQARARFGHYRHDAADPQSLSYDYVWSLHEDQSGTVWVGTDGGGLNAFNPETGRFRAYRHDAADPQSLSHNMVLTVTESRDGALWIGTFSGGLNRLDAEREAFTRYMPAAGDPTSLSHSVATSVLEDVSGTLWVGTWGGGLNRMDRLSETFTRFQRSDAKGSINDNVITTLAEDARGFLWVGTYSGGVNRLNPETGRFSAFRHIPGQDGGLSHNTIYTIHPGADGTIWLGTAGGGLNRLDPTTGAVTVYTTRDGLPHNIIYGILEDDGGRLWLTTNAGLARFDPEQGTVKTYTVADGLQSNEFNSGAIHRAQDGTFYIGGIHGFNRFHPAQLETDDYVPPVVLTGLRKFDEPVHLSQAWTAVESIDVSHHDNFITFEFAALDYTAPLRNQYRYRLKGVDAEWRTTDGQRPYASYTNLAGGDYVFHVMGAGSQGVWNETGRTLRMRVIPPFWQQAWFLSVAGVLILGGVFVGGWQWYNRREAQRAQRIADAAELQRRLAQSREEERLRMARDLHDGPVQDLYGARFQLETLLDEWPSGGSPQRAEGLEDTLGQVVGKLRDLCKELRPPLLGSFGVSKALEAFISGVQESQPALEVTAYIAKDRNRLSEQERLAIYRIAQETIRNVVRHAEATHLTVTFVLTDADAQLTVKDNGTGFRVPDRWVELARKDHLGLIGANERAASVGGMFAVTSQPGNGTTVRVTISLESHTQPTNAKPSLFA